MRNRNGKKKNSRGRARVLELDPAKVAQALVGDEEYYLIHPEAHPDDDFLLAS